MTTRSKGSIFFEFFWIFILFGLAIDYSRSTDAINQEQLTTRKRNKKKGQKNSNFFGWSDIASYKIQQFIYFSFNFLNTNFFSRSWLLVFGQIKLVQTFAIVTQKTTSMSHSFILPYLFIYLSTWVWWASCFLIPCKGIIRPWTRNKLTLWFS